jgi:hypothetical protein
VEATEALLDGGQRHADRAGNGSPAGVVIEVQSEDFENLAHG